MSFTIGGDYIPKGKGPDKPKGPIKVRKQKRKNSLVTQILNLPLEKDELKSLAKDLKKSLGCGGTLQDLAIELQGDKVELAKAFLIEKGYTVT